MKDFEKNANPLDGFHYAYLATSLIRDDFIIGEKYKCDDWMIEYINISETFLNKSNGKKYRKPKKEDNKECDCISEDYSLDFKRLVSSSYMNAQVKTSYRTVKCDNGMYVERAPADDKEYKAYLLEKICRFTEEKEYENPDLIEDEELKENISGILKTIETEKNLLCLFPIMVFPDQQTTINSFENTMLYLNLCYRDLFSFRKRIRPEFESYVSFFYNRDYVITEFDGNAFIEKERIPKSNSTVFKHLCKVNGYSFMNYVAESNR